MQEGIGLGDLIGARPVAVAATRVAVVMVMVMAMIMMLVIVIVMMGMTRRTAGRGPDNAMELTSPSHEQIHTDQEHCRITHRFQLVVDRQGGAAHASFHQKRDPDHGNDRRNALYERGGECDGRGSA